MEQKLDQKDFISCYPVWKEALTGKHKGIYTRGVTAWSNYVYYRCVVHAFLEAEKTQAKARLPYGLMNSYRNSFFVSTAIDLRSAIGGEKDSLFGKKGVHSLTAVLRSMAETRITRVGLFKANEIKYEYEDEEMQGSENMQKNYVEMGFGSPLSAWTAWQKSRDLHQIIDKLTSKNAASRSPDDVIPSKVFADAIKNLDYQTKCLTSFVNKHVAHAATQDSIFWESGNVSKISLDDFENTFSALIGTFDMLASELFRWAGYSFRLDVRSKLNAVEESFGVQMGSACLGEKYSELSCKLDNEIRKWRPIDLGDSVPQDLAGLHSPDDLIDWVLVRENILKSKPRL